KSNVKNKILFGGKHRMQSLNRICLDLLLPACFPTALVRLPTSSWQLHLDVTHYAFDETAAHLLNNRTKSVEGFNARFKLKWEKSNMKFCSSYTLYVNL
ncbi:hypothetical protein, partial [Prevotella koreensis]|uniref:hypothetical protein n=1 Tax=Prevotella koreensis TaxID=2490854 RepID=UPI0028F030E5